MCARLQLIRKANLLIEHADTNLCIAMRIYEQHYNKCVIIFPISTKRDNILLDRRPLFRSAADRYAAEGYNNLLPAKRDLYQVADVGEHTLKIIQEGLENTAAIHVATLASGHRRYCDCPVLKGVSVSFPSKESVNRDRS